MMVHRLARPEALQQVQAFVEALRQDHRVGRVAEARVLVLDGPTKARPEDHPSTAETVQCGHLARELLRTPPGNWCDQRAQSDP